MSLVPRDPASTMRKAYVRANEHDLETFSAPFWSGILYRTFNEDTYLVGPESAPDNSLRRADLLVEVNMPTSGVLTALLWVECKRPSGNAAEVEAQALDAASRCIVKDNLMWVFAMTTIGTKFRLWKVMESSQALEPMDGGPKVSSRAQYIDADSPRAKVFRDATGLMKEAPPLRQPPVIGSRYAQPVTSQQHSQYPLRPTQQHSHYQQHVVQDSQTSGRTSNHLVAQSNLPRLGASQQQQQYGMAQAGSSESHYGRNNDDYPMEDSSSGGGRAGVKNKNQIKDAVRVSVVKITHMMKESDYKFTDSKGKPAVVKRSDWQDGEMNGQKVYVVKHKGVAYYTTKLG